jgi:hypothetical protein
MAVSLEQFLAALARAVADAQHDLQRSQLSDLSQFFTNGAPITVDLKLPRASPDTGERQSIDVQVPLAILVSHAGISIRETQVTMQVEISLGAETTTATKRARTSTARTSTERPYGWQAPPNLPTISVSTVTGKNVGDAAVAQLTLRVAADEVPEGLARLLDHLNKML